MWHCDLLLCRMQLCKCMRIYWPFLCVCNTVNKEQDICSPSLPFHIQAQFVLSPCPISLSLSLFYPGANSRKATVTYTPHEAMYCLFVYLYFHLICCLDVVITQMISHLTCILNCVHLLLPCFCRQHTFFTEMYLHVQFGTFN